MFKVNRVKNCPVTRQSIGRIVIDRHLIGELVGTLNNQHNVEWLVLLLGKRSEDGMLVHVTGIDVPTDQRRTTAHVDLPQREVEDDVIGVLHSHHSMGAWFSSTDDKELNPRFPVSIVISTNMTRDQDNMEEFRAFGMAYYAEGQVTLPCGSLGLVRFHMEPSDRDFTPKRQENDTSEVVLAEPDPEWPFVWAIAGRFEDDVVFLNQEVETNGLGDCDRNEVVRIGYSEGQKSSCGLAATVITKEGFGRGTEAIDKLLPASVFQPTQYQSTYKGQNKIQDSRGWKTEDKRSSATEEKKWGGNGGFPTYGQDYYDSWDREDETWARWAREDEKEEPGDDEKAAKAKFDTVMEGVDQRPQWLVREHRYETKWERDRRVESYIDDFLEREEAMEEEEKTRQLELKIVEATKLIETAKENLKEASDDANSILTEMKQVAVKDGH